MNCGRCGRPIYIGTDVICDFCRKTVSRDATRHAAKMNRRKDEEEEMLMNMASPGKEEDVKGDLKQEHYANQQDASAVWARDDPSKGGSKRKKF
jgi:hypothetical protein